MNLIVFDFDGTIADSLEIFVKATNQLAKDFGYEEIASSQIPLLRTLSSKEIIRKLQFPVWKLPFFLRRLRQELTPFIVDLQFVPGMREALLEISKQGDRLGIVTSNSHQNVEEFLHLQGLENLFEFIYAGQVLSGKARVLKRLVKLNQIKAQQLIFVGDEVSDVKAAKQAGLASIAVSWGFNDRELLAKSVPNVLIDRPEQLLAAIAQVRQS